MTATRLRHALVIGAGLAGAAVCANLARRGWQITLVDAEAGPAQGASALPVGMLSPHVTRAPTPLSRLSALGVADTRRELERLVAPGAGWQVCEVDNLDHDPGRWPAALVRPAALVNAWLAEANAMGRLDTLWGAPVSRLRPAGAASDSIDKPQWVVEDRRGQAIASAPVVVITAALGSLDLLLQTAPSEEPTWLPLRPVQGQMSLGAQAGEPMAPRPQRRSGVFVPYYEDLGLPPRWPGRIWAMGSTYARGERHTSITREAHVDNARSLAAIAAPAATRLLAALDTGQLLGWAGVRCASLDRLPLVGAIPDVGAVHDWMREAGAKRGRLPLAEAPRLRGLFVLAALGSRGLSLAHWCARHLASQIDGASDPVEPDILRALDPARFAWKSGRRQPGHA